MKKIILDTNVLVSALIQKSYPYLIVYNYVFEDLIKVCISDELFKEYLEVLNRSKFKKYPDFLTKADFILAQIEIKAKKYYPQERFKIIKDVNDNKLIELAAISKADYLITGNINDFTMSVFRKTNIVTPKEFWDCYRP